MKKAIYLIYYSLLNKLPNSRYSKLFNRIRVGYATRLMGVMAKGSGSFIEEGVYLGGPGKVSIGFGCQINEDVFIQSAEIGNHVMIAPGAALLSQTHRTPMLDVPMANQGVTDSQPVIIEDDVWIGRNVVVMPGVRIETGAIVGAGAVVTRNVKSFDVVGGVPAKTIKNRKPCAELLAK